MGSLGGFPKPFDGRVNVKFTDFTMMHKENDEPAGKYWLLMKFASEDGDLASFDGNLFPDTEQKGRQTSTKITMRTLGEFLTACGLDPTSIDDTPDEIEKCLKSLVGEVTVSANIGKDEKGYNRADKFKKAS